MSIGLLAPIDKPWFWECHAAPLRLRLDPRYAGFTFCAFSGGSCFRMPHGTFCPPIFCYLCATCGIGRGKGQNLRAPNTLGINQ